MRAMPIGPELPLACLWPPFLIPNELIVNYEILLIFLPYRRSHWYGKWNCFNDCKFLQYRLTNVVRRYGDDNFSIWIGLIVLFLEVCVRTWQKGSFLGLERSFLIGNVELENYGLSVVKNSLMIFRTKNSFSYLKTHWINFELKTVFQNL